MSHELENEQLLDHASSSASIVLLAMDLSDGWAFVAERGRILLLRPPYRTDTVVSSLVVGAAVRDHGYESRQQDFVSRNELIAYLRRGVFERRCAEEKEICQVGVAQALPSTLPASVVERFLDRIKSELILQERFSDAERLLVAIQDSTTLTDILIRRAAELLSETRAALMHRNIEP